VIRLQCTLGGGCGVSGNGLSLFGVGGSRFHPPPPQLTESYQTFHAPKSSSV